MEMPAAEINTRTVEAISGVETEPGHPAVVEVGEATHQEEPEVGVELPATTASSRLAMLTGARVLRLVAMVEGQHPWEEVTETFSDRISFALLCLSFAEILTY